MSLRIASRGRSCGSTANGAGGGIGLPASVNAGNGYIAPAQVDQALDCLTKKTNCGGYATHGTWPALRGLMTWSVNWDKYSNWEFEHNFDGYFGS